MVGNKIKCLSKTRDFDDVVSIHIKDEDKPLTVKNTTVYHQFSVNFRTSEVTIGPTKLKTRPQNDERFALKAGIIEAAIENLASQKILDIVPIENPSRRGSSDLDDGVDPDQATTNPFPPLHFNLIKNKYKYLHRDYWCAKKTDFQNAFGKYYMII